MMMIPQVMTIGIRGSTSGGCVRLVATMCNLGTITLRTSNTILLYPSQSAEEGWLG